MSRRTIKLGATAKVKPGDLIVWFNDRAVDMIVEFQEQSATRKPLFGGMKSIVVEAGKKTPAMLVPASATRKGRGLAYAYYALQAQLRKGDREGLGDPKIIVNPPP